MMHVDSNVDAGSFWIQSQFGSRFIQRYWSGGSLNGRLLISRILQLSGIPRRLVAIAPVEISVVESKQIRIITHGADCGVLGRVLRKKNSGPAMSFFWVN